MTSVSAPVWAPWITYYDPDGQDPGPSAEVDGNGLDVRYPLDKLTLSLQLANDPLAGATGLSGALSVTVPGNLSLAGFRVVVSGSIYKTVSAEAVVSCSIGHNTQSLAWPAAAPTVDSDFILECFTSDAYPTGPGKPPRPPLPITLSVLASRHTADETIQISFDNFTVGLLLWA